MVNDALPNRILSGTIVVKGNIKRFTEDGIVFEGETKSTPVDDVIMATGYKIKFPFFDEDVSLISESFKFCAVRPLVPQ